MSMIYQILEISNEDIDQLLKDPECIENLLDESAADSKSLEKAWHGIHYLLTGSGSGGPEPLCYLMDGGDTVGDIDVGYGPARILKADKVKAFHEALSKINDADFTKRYDGEVMMESGIYPTVWDDESEKEWLVSSFHELKNIVSDAAKANSGLLLWMN
jgi:hypothetical protein